MNENVKVTDERTVTESDSQYQSEANFCILSTICSIPAYTNYFPNASEVEVISRKLRK
jgi:hypothetical protein